jgi:hypothetical protein
VPVEKEKNKGNIGKYSKNRHIEHMKIMANRAEIYTCMARV